MDQRRRRSPDDGETRGTGTQSVNREKTVQTEVNTEGNTVPAQGHQGIPTVIRTRRGKNEFSLELLEAEDPVSILISDFCL